VLDLALGDIKSLQARLGATESAKLTLHYEALREVELRIQSQAAPPVAGTGCESPSLDAQGLGAGVLYEPERFPTALRLQTELMVQAMACGLTRVGVIQASHHTSELIMSRFAGTEMYDPGFDMRSHQASHYGSSHDEQSREFVAYRAQRRWFVAQFAYLLGQLAARPEGEGTMLDHTVCLLMSEVADGNTHLHDNLPSRQAFDPTKDDEPREPEGPRGSLVTAPDQRGDGRLERAAAGDALSGADRSSPRRRCISRAPARRWCPGACLRRRGHPPRCSCGRSRCSTRRRSPHEVPFGLARVEPPRSRGCCPTRALARAGRTQGGSGRRRPRGC
jgi:hypothetical protein